MFNLVKWFKKLFKKNEEPQKGKKDCAEVRRKALKDAIDKEDLDHARRILEESPELIKAPLEWGFEMPLMRTIRRGKKEKYFDPKYFSFMKYLLKNGANPNGKAYPAIFETIDETGYFVYDEPFNLLVNQEGIDLDSDRRVLQQFAQYGEKRHLEVLLKKGVKTNQSSDGVKVDGKNSDYEYVRASSHHSIAEMCEKIYLLWQYGADKTLYKEDSMKAIFHILELDCVETAKLLLLSDPLLINEKDFFGNSLAHKSKSIDMVRLLQEFNADFNVQNEAGDTPLHIHTREDRFEIANLMWSLNADPNISNNLGETPIFDAGRIKKQNFIELYAKANVDVHHRAKDGTTFFNHLLYDQSGQKVVYVIGSIDSYISEFVDKIVGKNSET